MEREEEMMMSAGANGAARSGGGVILSILALVLGLSVGGVAGVFVFGPRLAQRITAERLAPAGRIEAPEGKASWEPGVVYQLENLIVNPASTQGTRFLVVTLAIELDGAVTAAELERREAEARDTVLRVLGSKTVAQLSDISARDELKVELLDALSGVVRIGEMRRLYLPQFVIQ
jgi:flagellar FliL protein